MKYRDKLPEGCPPDESDEITELREVFRLVRSNPPTDEDFLSQRVKKPRQRFDGVSECQICGLSVFSERSDSERLLKLPHLRRRLICRLRLDVSAGSIQKTNKNSHYTWWPFAKFDILAHCEIESP